MTILVIEILGDSLEQVLVATSDHIVVVDADSAQSQAHGQGPILALAVAPNGSFVAGTALNAAVA